MCRLDLQYSLRAQPVLKTLGKLHYGTTLILPINGPALAWSRALSHLWYAHRNTIYKLPRKLTMSRW